MFFKATTKPSEMASIFYNTLQLLLTVANTKVMCLRAWRGLQKGTCKVLKMLRTIKVWRRCQKEEEEIYIQESLQQGNELLLSVHSKLETLCEKLIWRKRPCGISLIGLQYVHMFLKVFMLFNFSNKSTYSPE